MDSLAVCVASEVVSNVKVPSICDNNIRGMIRGSILVGY